MSEFKRQDKHVDLNVKTQNLALFLHQKSYNVKIRMANKNVSLMSTSQQNINNQSRNAYIIIKRQKSIQSTENKHIWKVGEEEIVIQLGFREMFYVMGMDLDYLNTLESIPDIFIGNFDNLNNMVKICSNFTINYFEFNDLSIPPWRSQSAILSLWSSKVPLLSFKFEF